MNLIWHITKKDLRRFWVPLALVCAITLVRFGVGHALLRADAPDSEWFVRMGLYANVLRGLGLAVVYLLVAAVVQVDSLAGPAFWQTRPISRARLLGAKALGLGLMFGLLPVLVALPWWLSCGFGGQDVLRAAAEGLGIQAGVVLLALPWAVVTDGFGRFLLYSLVAAVAGATCFIDLAARIPGFQPVSDGAGPTRLLLMGAVAGAVSLSVALHQFATRRTWRSMGLIVLGALALLATACESSWDASHFWAPRRLPPSGLSADVKASFLDARLYSTGPDQQLAFGHVLVGLDGVPPHLAVAELHSEQTLRWPDGTIERQVRGSEGGNWFPVDYVDTSFLLRSKPMRKNPDPDWVRTRARLTVRREPEMPAADQSAHTGRFFLGAGGKLGERLMSQPATLEGTYWFGLVRPELVGEQPVAVGSEFAEGPRHARIAGVSVEPRDSALRLVLVERSPSGLFRPMDPSYSFVNIDRRGILEGLNEVRLRTTIEGVEIVLCREAFVGFREWDSRVHRFAFVPGAFDGGTLAEIQNRVVQRFNRDLVVPGFRMKPPFAPPASPETVGDVSVSGAVNRPSTFEAKRGETVLEALRSVGGFTETADMGAVTLIRIGDDGLPVQLVLDVGAYLDGRIPETTFPALREGDLIQVPERKQP